MAIVALIASSWSCLPCCLWKKQWALVSWEWPVASVDPGTGLECPRCKSLLQLTVAALVSLFQMSKQETCWDYLILTGNFSGGGWQSPVKIPLFPSRHIQCSCQHGWSGRMKMDFSTSSSVTCAHDLPLPFTFGPMGTPILFLWKYLNIYLLCVGMHLYTHVTQLTCEVRVSSLLLACGL